jgi:hypothetical protein
MHAVRHTSQADDVHNDGGRHKHHELHTGGRQRR